MANVNQDLIGIPLAKSRGKEIERKEFNEKSFFHQDPPLGAPIRGGSGLTNEGTTMRDCFGKGDKVANHYGRYFGPEE
ncbi:hypothetical protein IEQ34_017094 [Dendrobium chrysotoxum]|uniref:Uncharacterized protein n=1 Tax=Dendrobium chrysotoxum TaxID=161865 RepID=A0AAV7G9B2_DENCH|nr:hypothetical protein IEQ34_017094 [Dendrobium chrysotoxum]